MADIVSTLEAVGFQVTCVADGHQGLRRVYESRPDLVIVAEQVPGINGEELCSKMRLVSLLPIIVVGNRQEGAAKSACLRPGLMLTCPNRRILWSWWPGCASAAPHQGAAVPFGWRRPGRRTLETHR